MSYGSIFKRRSGLTMSEVLFTLAIIGVIASLTIFGLATKISDAKTIEKIRKLKEYTYQNNLDTYIEADGGINLENAILLKEAGVDIMVVGSFIINSENYKKTIQDLKKY